MLVRDCMTRRVVTASPETSVLAARRLMTLHGIRHLPVVAGDEVVGVVSDRDVRINDRQLVASLGVLQSDLVTGRYRRLALVMTAPAHVIDPKMKLHVAAEYMVSRRIGALPVVEDGRLVGIISLTDCVRALAAMEQHARWQLSEAGDIDAVTPMPAGDPRPGRPNPKRAAVVVDPDPVQRLRARRELVASGYSPVTCPGPSARTYCPAVHDGGAAARCSRVPADTDLVVLRPDEHSLAVAEAYARWLPAATIRFGSVNGAPSGGSAG